jgi:hypothetical protein
MQKTQMFLSRPITFLEVREVHIGSENPALPWKDQSAMAGG